MTLNDSNKLYSIRESKFMKKHVSTMTHPNKKANLNENILNMKVTFNLISTIIFVSKITFSFNSEE